jgi:hypothetical protein
MTPQLEAAIAAIQPLSPRASTTAATAPRGSLEAYGLNTIAPTPARNSFAPLIRHQDQRRTED